MQTHEFHTCGKIGTKNSVLCATLGVLAACLILTAWGAIAGIAVNSDGLFKVIVFISLVALYLAASCLGKLAGRFLCKRSSQMLNVIIGVGLALSCVAISVLTGSLSLVVVNMIVGSPDSTDLATYLVVPLLVVLIYGGAPAVILGVLYGVLVGTQLTKMRAQAEAEQVLGAASAE
jgi:hypothetical protein